MSMEEQEQNTPTLASTDIWLYTGQVSMRGYEQLCTLIEGQSTHDKALLVLATPGGDPHAGFRIARALQHYYGGFDVLVPRYCKSAGTLICVGAKTLYLANQSELGPLDVQIKKSDELVGRNSGLDILQAVSYLQNQALDAFKTYVNDLTKSEGLSTKVASDMSSKLTSGLFSPIFAQIDPMKLAEMQRATEIAFAYGTRLNEASNILEPNGLARLVIQYPSHGFIIDRKEARLIFSRVLRPENEMKKLSDYFDSQSRAHIDDRYPTVLKFEPTLTASEHDKLPGVSGLEKGDVGSVAEGSETGGGISED